MLIKVDKVQVLLLAHGGTLATMANLSVLKTGKAKAVRFTTLDALCRALDCQPGDILEYVAEE